MIFLLCEPGMGSPRRAHKRRRRTRESPEPASVRTPFGIRKIEITWCRGAVQSAWHSSSSEPHQRGGTIGQRGGKIGLPGNRKVVATWYGDDSPHLSLRPQPQFSQRQYCFCARVPRKAGDTVNILRMLRPQRVKGSTRSKVGTKQIWLRRVTTYARTGRCVGTLRAWPPVIVSAEKVRAGSRWVRREGDEAVPVGAPEWTRESEDHR